MAPREKARPWKLFQVRAFLFMKKILVYGYKPWGDKNKNISEEIVNQLPDSDYIEKKILQVGFDKKSYINMVNMPNIKFVLGLGQTSRKEKLRVEKYAFNEYKENRKIKRIFEEGLDRLTLETKFKVQDQVLSYSMGRFVCNFGAYVIEDYCRKNEIKSGFVHIPSKYNLVEATKIILENLTFININY